ncbi:unnamed protein product [Strongylus vulgaris]|uniref:glutathione transferase n=1 Tax=Strongylus vulgaris TaxID=40348 RepID=A0A3P7IJF4_STRVU|nr:unnamed protein product [Strongylus vulgaris]
MVHYKLIYFNIRGLGEVIRQIFALAGEEFEDFRYSFDEWPEHKSEMPFGQMPVLEVDGQQLAQSHAIARFLARKFGVFQLFMCEPESNNGLDFSGLTPKCPFEEALVDSIMDQYKDFFTEIRIIFRVIAGFEKGDVDQIIKDVVLPARDKFFPYMTKFLKKNNSGYLVGSSITVADLLLAELSAEFSKTVPTLCDGFPEIKAHAEKVRSNPALKKWIETRPKTDF